MRSFPNITVTTVTAAVNKILDKGALAHAEQAVKQSHGLLTLERAVALLPLTAIRGVSKANAAQVEQAGNLVTGANLGDFGEIGRMFLRGQQIAISRPTVRLMSPSEMVRTALLGLGVQGRVARMVADAQAAISAATTRQPMSFRGAGPSAAPPV